MSRVRVAGESPFWPVGQAVKTPPFHGGIPGSIPGRVTTYGRLAQLGERLPYKQDVGSSILSSSTTCGNSSAVEHRLAKAGVASSNLVSRSNFIWRHSQAVRQRSAKPLFPSSILGAASTIVTHAGVAEQADATDLKSVGWKQPYRFDSGPRHQLRLTSVSLFSYVNLNFKCV